jgi:arginine exporter protein ArgO
LLAKLIAGAGRAADNHRVIKSAPVGGTAIQHHRDPDSAPPAGPGLATPIRAYSGLLGLSPLNPITIVYFGALALARQPADGSLFFVLGAFLASASWQLLIAVGGSLVGRRGNLKGAPPSTVCSKTVGRHR